MSSSDSISEAQAVRLAETVGLDPDEVLNYREQLDSILSSISPVETYDEQSYNIPEIAGESRPDPYNVFITSVRVESDSGKGTLRGLEVAVKDNIALAGVRMTAGSDVLRGCVAEQNATVVDRLLDADATVVGKTNMDEFAFGPTGETSAFGSTQNPKDTDYTPGGSSSGSAAAVAAGAADLALGTDTGGSVRIPASFCGVYGFKPTIGRIPLHGVIELARSLDTVGLLGRDLDSIQQGFTVLSGVDNQSADTKERNHVLEDLQIGVPEQYFESPTTAEVATVVEETIADLIELNLSTETVSLPRSEMTSAVWRAITMSELYRYVSAATQPYRIRNARRPVMDTAVAAAFASNLDRLSPPLQQYLLVGSHLVDHDQGRTYGQSLSLRNEFRDNVTAVFEEVDIIACPTTPTTAFEFGTFSRSSSPPINNNTHLFNHTGHPAISLPCGTIDGLPVGLQLVGPRGADLKLLSVAKGIAEALDIEVTNK